MVCAILMQWLKYVLWASIPAIHGGVEGVRRLLGDLTDFPSFLGVCWRGLDGEPHEGVAPLMFLSNADWVNIFMEIIVLRQFVQHRNNTLPLHMQVKHSFPLFCIYSCSNYPCIALYRVIQESWLDGANHICNTVQMLWFLVLCGIVF